MPKIPLYIIPLFFLPYFFLFFRPFSSDPPLTYSTDPQYLRAPSTCPNFAPYIASNNLIVSGSILLPVSPASPNTIIPDSIIAICNGVIMFAGPRRNFNYISKKYGLPCRAPVLRLNPTDVVAPAFINAHTHAAMSLFKNLGNDRELSKWLNNFIFPLEARFVTEKFCRVGTKLAMAEFLASGTSTFADMYFFQDAVAEEVVKVGMRAFLGESIIDFPQPDSPTPDNTLKMAEAWIQKWKPNELVDVFLSPHAPYTTSRAVYESAVAMNRKYGVRTYTHCSETQSENEDMRKHQGLSGNITATEFLKDAGVLGEDLTCAHSVWLSDGDIELYKETGTKVAHCPSSNLKLASGFMRYSALKNAGVDISIGTDGHASNNDVDLVEEARIAALIHKGVDLNPTTLSALEALEALTMGGAKAVGRENKQGSIEFGKLADLVVFRGRSLKWTPRFDIGKNGSMDAADTAAMILYDANAADVKATIVNGKLLYFEGCYGTIDIDTVRKEAQDVAQEIRDFLSASSR